jgi:hypothetical protein
MSARTMSLATLLLVAACSPAPKPTSAPAEVAADEPVAATETATPPAEIVEEIEVTILNECPEAIEVFFGPDPLPDGATPVQLDAGASMTRAMRLGEQLWKFHSPDRQGYIAASVDRQGGTLSIGESCNDVTAVEGSGPRRLR